LKSFLFTTTPILSFFNSRLLFVLPPCCLFMAGLLNFFFSQRPLPFLRLARPALLPPHLLSLLVTSQVRSFFPPCLVSTVFAAPPLFPPPSCCGWRCVLLFLAERAFPSHLRGMSPTPCAVPRLLPGPVTLYRF